MNEKIVRAVKEIEPGLGPVPFRSLVEVSLGSMVNAYSLLCLVVRARPDLQSVVNMLSDAIEALERRIDKEPGKRIDP